MQNNFPDDFMKAMSEYDKQHNQELREVFKRYIKPSFMIRTKEDIKHMPAFINLLPSCYQFSFSTLRALGADDIDFDICINLSMIVWYLLLPIKDDKKHELYNDISWVEDVKKRTIQQCQIRPLIQTSEERNFLLAHTPLNYSMHCLSNYLLTHINDKLKKRQRPDVPNFNFKINSLIVMLKNIRAILLLTESDNCGSAFSLLRALIESVFIYLAIYDDETTAAEYYKFMDFRNEYESTGRYPQGFLDILPSKAQKQNYLNYGWLDSIERKRRHYTFSEVLEYSVKTNKEYNDIFLAAYKYCCKFSHGNYINQSIPLHSFIWVLGKAGQILVNLARQYSYMFQEEVVYNGINLEEQLIANVEESTKIFSQLNVSH